MKQTILEANPGKWRGEMDSYLLYICYYAIFTLAIGFYAVCPKGNVAKADIAISAIFLLIMLAISTFFILRYRGCFDFFEPINIFNGIMVLFFVLYPLYMLGDRYKAILVFQQAGGDLEQFLPFLFKAVNYAIIGVAGFFTGYTLFLNRKMGKTLIF
ncbi:MAG: hypothetical protein GY757_04515, partial [bacterium]|nr:hypothetical protein [bacterium]